MSVIIAKNAGTPFKEQEVWREVIFKEPLYIGLAYADEGRVNVEKYVETFERGKESNIDRGFKRLEALTDFNVMAFFEHKRKKAFEKDQNNIPPILMNNNQAYVSAGEILNLGKQSKQLYSDSFYIKEVLFEPITKTNPDLFFDFGGIWLLQKFIPYSAALVFLKGNGDLSLINQMKGQTFNEMWCYNTDFKPRPFMTV